MALETYRPRGYGKRGPPYPNRSSPMAAKSVNSEDNGLMNRSEFAGCADHRSFEQTVGTKPAGLASQHRLSETTLYDSRGGFRAWTLRSEAPEAAQR
jgi:hypothetical protein